MPHMLHANNGARDSAVWDETSSTRSPNMANQSVALSFGSLANLVLMVGYKRPSGALDNSDTGFDRERDHRERCRPSVHGGGSACNRVPTLLASTVVPMSLRDTTRCKLTKLVNVATAADAAASVSPEAREAAGYC